MICSILILIDDISRENLWFPVDFPLSQPIDCSGWDIFKAELPGDCCVPSNSDEGLMSWLVFHHPKSSNPRFDWLRVLLVDISFISSLNRSRCEVE